jgi:hypothetical protein
LTTTAPRPPPGPVDAHPATIAGGARPRDSLLALRFYQLAAADANEIFRFILAQGILLLAADLALALPACEAQRTSRLKGGDVTQICARRCRRFVICGAWNDPELEGLSDGLPTGSRCYGGLGSLRDGVGAGTRGSAEYVRGVRESAYLATPALNRRATTRGSGVWGGWRPAVQGAGAGEWRAGRANHPCAERAEQVLPKNHPLVHRTSY